VRQSVPTTVPLVRAAPWRFGDGVVAALPGVVTIGPVKLAELTLSGSVVTDTATLEGKVRLLVRQSAPSNANFNTQYTLARALLYESLRPRWPSSRALPT